MRQSPSTELLILGDSISLGISELRGNTVAQRVSPSYVDRLRQWLPTFTIAVDAEMHRTTAQALARLPDLLATHRPDAVLVMLGGNDADLEWKRFVVSDGRVARARVPVEQYMANLRAIAGAVANAGAVTVLTDMPNHDLPRRGVYTSALCGKDITSLLEKGGGQAATDASLQLYRQAVRQVAQETGCLFVNYGEQLGRHDRHAMCGPDGGHPSAAAHEYIAEALLPALETICERIPTPVGSTS